MKHGNLYIVTIDLILIGLLGYFVLTDHNPAFAFPILVGIGMVFFADFLSLFDRDR